MASLSLRPNHHHHHYPNRRTDPTNIIIITQSLHTQPPSSLTQLASSWKTNPFKPKPTQSETHSIGNLFSSSDYTWGWVRSRGWSCQDAKPHRLVTSGPWRRGFRQSQRHQWRGRGGRSRSGAEPSDWRGTPSRSRHRSREIGEGWS